MDCKGEFLRLFLRNLATNSSIADIICCLTTLTNYYYIMAPIFLSADGV